MRINNNISALTAYRMYSINAGQLGRNIERLSSGFRVNRAADDAAGLAISETMRTQIRGLRMASRNAQDGVSLVQTAEGAMQAVHEILQRKRELIVQAASDINAPDVERSMIQAEIEQLAQELVDITTQTEFNGQRILDMDVAGIPIPNIAPFSAGFESFAALNLQYRIQHIFAAAMHPGGFLDQITDLNNEFNAMQPPYYLIFNIGIDFLNTLDDAIGAMSALIYNVESVIDQVGYDAFDDVYLVPWRVSSGQGWLPSIFNNMNRVRELIVDSITQMLYGYIEPAWELLDYAFAFFNYSADNYQFIMTTAWNLLYNVNPYSDPGNGNGNNGNGFPLPPEPPPRQPHGFQIQVGANSGQLVTIDLPNLREILAELVEFNPSARLNVNLDSASEVSTLLDGVDRAIAGVSAARATLGAQQNRLEHKMRNLDNTAENLQAAESRIRDTDMAGASTESARSRIMFEASIAMLAQANTKGQNVLQLLG